MQTAGLPEFTARLFYSNLHVQADTSPWVSYLIGACLLAFLIAVRMWAGEKFWGDD